MEKQAQIQINRFIKNKTLIKKYVVLLLAFTGTALNELLASVTLSCWYSFCACGSCAVIRISSW